MDQQMRPLLTSIPLTFVLAFGFSHRLSAESGSNPANVAPGHYHCHPLVSGPLTILPGFTIHDDGTYRHDDGSEGKYTYDSAEGLVRFEGGSLDKQTGHVAPNSKLGIVRIYTRGSTTGVNCDTMLH
jgi:hypothetical protein